jgi:hypothetical protein
MATSTGTNKSKSAAYLIRIATFFSVILILGIAMAICFSKTARDFSTLVIWIICMYVAGAAVGFLFGIPKILQSGKKNDDPGNGDDYHLQVNTNLTDISDWLTKIIVGLGLVKLAKLGPYISSVAQSLAGGLETKDPPALAFAYGVIICYSVSGFLFGYLITRLFLSKAFSEADQQALQKIAASVKQVADKADETNKLVAASQAKIDNIKDKQEIIAQTVYPAGSLPDATPRVENEGTVEGETPPIETKINQLKKLADDYNAIHADTTEARESKNAIASSMGKYVLDKTVGKQAIASLLKNDYNEGLLMALATAITMRPETGDFLLLFNAIGEVSHLYVRYRILTALGILCDKQFIPAGHKQDILALLKRFDENADDSLQKKIADTTTLITSSLAD